MFVDNVLVIPGYNYGGDVYKNECIGHDQMTGRISEYIVFPRALTISTEINNLCTNEDSYYYEENINSVTYDASTGNLVLTGVNFDTSLAIDVSKLTITGQGGSTAQVTLTSATSNPTPTNFCK